MNLNYYVIRGRGAQGHHFQLAKLEDEAGNTLKGQYDMGRHFSSIDEMKSYIASDVIKKDVSEFELVEMDI